MTSSRVTISVSIAALPATVFAYMIDLDRHQLWITGLVNLSKGGNLSEGLEYEQTSYLMGREFQSRNRVNLFERDRVLGIENLSGPLNYRIIYGLVAQPDNTTQLTCQCDISGKMSFFNLAAPLLEYLAQSRLEADLNILKVLIEHG